MSPVSNQPQLYHELKVAAPIKEFCPRFWKLIRQTTLIASIFFSLVVVGAMLGLCDWGISVTAGAIGGGVVGLVAGGIAIYYTKLPSRYEQYRLEVLETLKRVIHSKKGLAALQALRQFFYYPFTEFKQYFMHHMLHVLLTKVGDSIDPMREDLKKIWLDFLNHLHGIPFKTPEGEKITFNTATLVRRFEGKQIDYEIKQLGTDENPLKEEDLQQIQKIGKASFGNTGTSSQEFDLRKIIFPKTHPYGVHIAKEKGTGKIIAYAVYVIQDKKIKIIDLARLPEVAQINLGLSLLVDILHAERQKRPVEMTIRKSNPYFGKLQEYGFQVTKELPKCYKGAVPEDGILLALDWHRFQQWINQLESPS